MRERIYTYCVLLTALIVQFTKGFAPIKYIPTQLYSIVISFCVLYAMSYIPPLSFDYENVKTRGQRYIMFTVEAVIFSLSSNGLFSLIKRFSP